MSNKTFDNNKKNVNPFAKLASIGIEFGIMAAIFCYIGYKVDAAYDTSPFFLLAGFFVSFIGMLYLTFKQVKNMWRR